MTRGYGGFLQDLAPAVRRALQVLHDRISSLETATSDSGWIDVTFENSWYDYAGSWDDVQYRKIGDVVHLKGLARKDSAFTSPDTIFTLPEGFRPEGNNIHAVRAYVSGGPGASAERLTILNDGTVRADFAGNSTAGNWASLAGVSFPLGGSF